MKLNYTVIAIFCVLLGIVVFVLLNQAKNTKKAPDTLHTVTISFNPSPLRTKLTDNNNQYYAAEVVVDSGGAPISGVQIELMYDPAILQNVQFVPSQNTNSSPFFGDARQSIILTNLIDTTRGRVSYVVAISQSSNPKAGIGKLGTLTFTLNKPKIGAASMVNFSSQTQVTRKGLIGQSVLKNAIPLVIKF